MKITPTSNRLLVKLEEIEETRQTGLIVPTVSNGDTRIGNVISAGHGKRHKQDERASMEVSAGDRVVASMYGAIKTHLFGDGEFIFISEDNILAVIEEDGDEN